MPVRARPGARRGAAAACVAARLDARAAVRVNGDQPVNGQPEAGRGLGAGALLRSPLQAPRRIC